MDVTESERVIACVLARASKQLECSVCGADSELPVYGFDDKHPHQLDPATCSTLEEAVDQWVCAQCEESFCAHHGQAYGSCVGCGAEVCSLACADAFLPVTFSHDSCLQGPASLCRPCAEMQEPEDWPGEEDVALAQQQYDSAAAQSEAFPLDSARQQASYNFYKMLVNQRLVAENARQRMPLADGVVRCVCCVCATDLGPLPPQ